MNGPVYDPAQTRTEPGADAAGLDPIAPDFVRDVQAQPELAARRWMEEVHPRVFRLPAFDPEVCARLSRRLDALRAERLRTDEVPPPNSMHEAGFSLASVGGAGLVEGWLNAWIRPLARVLYPDLGGAELDRTYSFVVDYARDADEQLGFHVDHANVTVNLCLEGPSEGAELYFRGLRCDRHRQGACRADELFEITHVPGTAILHAGPHRHGVHPLQGGARRNLILWCQAGAEHLPACGAERVAWCAN